MNTGLLTTEELQYIYSVSVHYSEQEIIYSPSLSPGKGVRWDPEIQRHPQAQRKKWKKRQAPKAGSENRESDKTETTE